MRAATRPTRVVHTGFTLIELMIVVAIIGILASVAITSFYKYSLRAKAAEIPINLDALVKGTMVYWQTEHYDSGNVISSRLFPAQSWVWAPSPMGFNCVYGGKYPTWPWLWESIPQFDAIGFVIETSSFMSYSFYPTRNATNNGSLVGDAIHLQAIGDLACDGPPWTNYGRTLTVTAAGNLTGTPMWINFSESGI